MRKMYHFQPLGMLALLVLFSNLSADLSAQKKVIVNHPKQAKKEEPAPVKPKMPLSRSICLLKGENGTATGFFAEIGGQNMVLTSTGKLCALKNVKILDIHGKAYPFTKILVSKTKDLALVIVDRKNQESLPDLPLMGDIGKMNVKAPVTVFGHITGEDGVVRSTGEFLGIKKGDLKVSVRFEECSVGGPVVDNATQTVIGIMGTESVIKETTPEDKNGKAQLRTFDVQAQQIVIPLNDLRISGFDPVQFADIESLGDTYRKLNDLYEKLTMEVEARTDKDLYDQLSELFDKEQIPAMPAQIKSSWLKKEMQTKLDALNMFRGFVTFSENGTPSPLLPPEAWAEIKKEKIQKIWTSALKEIQFKTLPEVTRKCLVCNGTKKISVKNDGNKNKLQADKRRVDCPRCEGTGVQILHSEVEYAVLPQKVENSLLNSIPGTNRELLGFKLGVPDQAPYRLHSNVYSTKQHKETKDALFTVFRFNGHHQLGGVAESRFWMIGSRIYGIDLIIPVKSQEDAEQMIDNAEKQFPKVQNAAVSAFIVEKAPTAPKHLPKNAKPDFIDQLESAEKLAAEDPFYTYYKVSEVGEKPVFVVISLRHSDFEFLESLFRMRTRGLFDEDEEISESDETPKKPAKKEKLQPSTMSLWE